MNLSKEELIRTISKKYQKSLSTTQLIEKISDELKSNSIFPSQTVVGLNVCRDDSISKIIHQLHASGFKQHFSLRTLTGLPIAGKTGITAYYHHLHQNNTKNLPGVIIFAPHIGVSLQGEFGKVDRTGQTCASNSCGANHALFHYFNNYKSPCSVKDLELKNVFDLLLKSQRVDEIMKSSNPIEKLVELEFEIGSQLLEEIIIEVKENEENKHGILLICGIHIDTPNSDICDIENYFELRSMKWI